MQSQYVFLSKIYGRKNVFAVAIIKAQSIKIQY